MAPAWLERLRQDPSCYPHPTGQITLIETHISWVLLTGNWAYKIKKPVALDFLDFSTLSLRHRYCKEELRLNHRFAPDLYEAVVPITSTEAGPRIGGAGPRLEYAVKMRQFDQSALLTRQLEAGTLSAADWFALGSELARVHQTLPAVLLGAPLDAAWQPMADNFAAIRERLAQATDLRALATLEHWSRAELERLGPRLVERNRSGWVRECHGDLHLENIAWIDGRFRPFDCIEFAPELRQIDVQSELAFLTMDLEDHGDTTAGHRVANGYLEASGDYSGAELRAFFSAYRALVRSKVALMRAEQQSDEHAAATRARAVGYLHLARSYSERRTPWLAITHGFSGAGKSTFALDLAAATGAVRIRSDVERKRLYKVAPDDHAANPALYSAAASDRTFTRLEDLAQQMLRAGLPVIVDATFLHRARRRQFIELATRERAPWRILSLKAPADILRKRVAHRLPDASDANLKVLEQQFGHHDPLEADEQAHAIEIDVSDGWDLAEIRARWPAAFARSAG